MGNSMCMVDKSTRNHDIEIEKVPNPKRSETNDDNQFH